MKKWCVLSVILICVQVTSYGQLRWLNPSPSGFINNKIQFINPVKGYMMNTNGDLFVSKDTGNSWVSAGKFEYANTFKISGSTGVIPSNPGFFYLSTDSGATWQQKNNLPANTYIWTDLIGQDTIFFQQANAGTTTFYKSVDKGATWQTITGNVDQFYVGSVDFITSKVGYALRADGVYKTVNGGSTWDTVNSKTNSSNFTSFKFFDIDNGFAFRETYGMYKTTDGGKNWTLNSDIPFDINDIFYVDLNNAFAVGDHGFVYKTTNAGASWNLINPQPLADMFHLYSQYFFTPTYGIVVGFRGRVLKTRDGGATWSSPVPGYLDVNAIAFPDKNNGYAILGDQSYKTINGGQSWTPLSLQTTPLGNIYQFTEHAVFRNKDTGLITASSPARIFKTLNGGANWTQISPAPTDYDYISAMSFVSNDTGYISLRTTGYNGLFKTYNGGDSWQEVGTHQNFHKLFFLNDKLGYATLYADVFRTIDGGNTWTQCVTYDYTEITSLFFTNASTGFITSNQGYLKMTSDSGRTWTPVTVSPNLPNLVTIKFFDQKNGFITVDDGGVYKTINGGLSWKYLDNTGNHQCKYVVYRSDTTVVFGGIQGTIVSANVGGYSIDSLKAIPQLCGAGFSAVVTLSLIGIDSSYYEYGRESFDHSIKATVTNISSGVVKISAATGELETNNTYKMRLKIFRKGYSEYSDEIAFSPQAVEKPVISLSLNVLSSSYTSGNQWYFENSIIPGATSQTYVVSKPGKYSVQVTQNNCTVSSENYIFIRPLATAGPGGVIRIYPNPVVTDEIFITIRQYQGTSVFFYDLFGRNIIQRPLVAGTNSISLIGLPPGPYFIKIIGARGVVIKNGRVMKL